MFLIYSFDFPLSLFSVVVIYYLLDKYILVLLVLNTYSGKERKVKILSVKSASSANRHNIFKISMIIIDIIFSFIATNIK